MICTHCGSPAAPTVGNCPGCGRAVDLAPATSAFPGPLSAPAPDVPASPYSVPVDPYTGPTTGDPFAPAPIAADGSGAMPSSAPPAGAEPFTPAPPPYAPAQQAAPQSPPAPYGPPPAGQPYPDHPYPGQSYPGQPYPGQSYPGPYPGQPYPGQPYPGQPYPGQPHPGQQPYAAYPGYPQPASDSTVLTVLAFVLSGFGVLLTSPMIAIVGLVLAAFAKRRHERNARIAIGVATGCVVAAFVLNILLKGLILNF
ncbi:hypothetical protein [Actinoplanes siamensis]|uniref:DUF4190 domain-containing protein n=1 Tax=Actinoplanes siamensis TaxID=1223317 RepID=A0A919N4M1_9ACTN|nr:hypothetical protein [Actinoplanes siamensis]GIF04301.1 hypothetical protein Asi03nite_18390 [Actinoplanes siamensis]